MANKKKMNKKPGRGGRIALAVFALMLLAVAVTAAIGMANASLLRIRRAEVVLADLPPGFDGVSILYASDIDLCGLNTPEKAGALFGQLQSLKPDLLILGGDYTSVSVLDRLNRPNDMGDDISKQKQQRSEFFHSIKSFSAPLGKYAVASPEDPDWQDLRIIMEKNDIRPLFNARAEVRSNGDSLWLVGVCEENANLNAVGGNFSHKDCVIVAAFSPAVLPILLTSEAKGGGQWADLALCGHTHGGQIRLLSRNVISLTEAEQRFISGWNTDSGTPVLTTEGIGCEGINLRLGSEPEVWLITLRRE